MIPANVLKNFESSKRFWVTASHGNSMDFS